MRRRLLESLGVAAVMAALVLFLQLSAAGQAPVAKAPAATATGAQKTAWGHPDIQGIWLDEFDTPLARPHRMQSGRAMPGATSARRLGRARMSPAPTTRYSRQRSRPAGAPH